MNFGRVGITVTEAKFHKGHAKHQGFLCWKFVGIKIHSNHLRHSNFTQVQIHWDNIFWPKWNLRFIRGQNTFPPHAARLHPFNTAEIRDVLLLVANGLKELRRV